MKLSLRIGENSIEFKCPHCNGEEFQFDTVKDNQLIVYCDKCNKSFETTIKATTNNHILQKLVLKARPDETIHEYIYRLTEVRNRLIMVGVKDFLLFGRWDEIGFICESDTDAENLYFQYELKETFNSLMRSWDGVAFNNICKGTVCTTTEPIVAVNKSKLPVMIPVNSKIKIISATDFPYVGKIYVAHPLNDENLVFTCAATDINIYHFPNKGE